MSIFGQWNNAIWRDFSRGDLERFVHFGVELADRLERYASRAERERGSR